MISVIFGHTATALKAGHSLNCGCYPYIPFLRPLDMPLFMAVSGYFFYFSCNKRTWQEILLNRATMVLIPCVVWGWIQQLLLFPLHPDKLSWLPYCMWFLWSMLGCCVLTEILHITLGAKCWIGAMALTTLSLFISSDTSHIGYMFPFFFMGYMVSRWDLTKKFRWWHGVLASVIFIMFYAQLGTPFTESWSVWSSQTYLFGPLGVQRHAELYLYRMGMGFFGCLSFAWVIYMLCRQCHQLPKKYTICRRLYHLLLLLGEYSLAVYCVQTILVETVLLRGMYFTVRHLGHNPLLNNPTFFFAGILPCTVVTAILLCLGIHHLLARKKTLGKLLFGK